MRIEDINLNLLGKASEEELNQLRLRFLNIHNRFFKNSRRQAAQGLDRDTFLRKYALLKREFSDRNMKIKSSALDEEMNSKLMKKAVWGCDIPDLGEITLVENFVSAVGEFVKNPKGTDKMQINLRKTSEELGVPYDLEIKISRTLRKRIQKEPEFLYDPLGPQTAHLPMFDLILRPKEETRIVDVSETELKKRTLDALRKSGFFIKFIGTGSELSPRKNECLFMQADNAAVLINGGPDIHKSDLPGEPDAVLVCDKNSELKGDFERIAKSFGLKPDTPESLTLGQMEIKKEGDCYLIEAKGQTIVYAPEFEELPKELLKSADLAILDGSSWNRNLKPTDKKKGHTSVLNSWTALEGLGVGRVIFTKIGPSTEKHLDEAAEMGIELAEDGQVIRLVSRLEKKEIDIEKPEVRGGKVRIPVGGACEITATITIDASQGITALYCGKDKRIRTYLFDAERWTMETARAWIREHKEKIEKNLDNIIDKQEGPFNCECIECGYTVESDEHCADLKCPKCGGQMRREERPGPGQKVEKAEMQKPKVTEHSARLKSPENYDNWSRTNGGTIYFNIKVPESIDIVWGHPKGQPPKRWIPQALRFPVKNWSVDAAKKWLADNKIKYSSFTVASGKMTKSLDEPHQCQYCEEPAKWAYIFKGGEDFIATCAKHRPEAKDEIETGYKDKIMKAQLLPQKKPELSPMFKICKVEKKKQIVGGVVYEPYAPDTQGDWTDEKEIEKAMYLFMEKYAAGKAAFKVQHRGKEYEFPILECFQTDKDIQRGGQTIKKGAWYLTVKITQADIWEEIESGAINGFSMGGVAKA